MRKILGGQAARRSGAVVMVLGLVTSLAGTFTPASGEVGDAPVVTLEDGVNGCNGVRPTPGSENTTKRLDPDFAGNFDPGGVVGFVIDYPVDESDVSGRTTFVITDCVFVDGTAVAKYSVSFVPNTTGFQLRFAVPVPPGTPLGAELCNYAKTTAAPSESQASNRKAGPACFTVGGSLRIEKRSGSATGPLLPGASFSVVCSPTVALPPTVITGLSSQSHADPDGTVSALGVAGTGAVAINGPSGTACTVTETEAPPGYQLDPTSRRLLIPVGTSQSVDVFVNQQLGDLVITKSTTGGSGTFTFDVDCDGTASDQSLTITDRGSRTITGIPTGTSCTVTERASALFTSTSVPADGTVVIGASAATVAFANTAQPTGISLDKKLNGGDHASAGEVLVVHPGDPLAYTVTIGNTGAVPVTIESLADTLEPGFAAACPQPVGSVLAAGASFTCTYQRTAASDATNTASVQAVDGLGRTSTASDSTFVAVIDPAIAIVKVASPTSVSPGQEVTFGYTVTNTGDTTLHDVAVTDDVLGGIAFIGTMQPGAVVSVNRTQAVQADGPTRNIGTATGTDVLGRTVSASSAADIAIVLGVTLERGPDLPRTGAPISLVALAGLALLVAGTALVAAGRRAED